MPPPRGRDLSPEPKDANSIGNRIRTIRLMWSMTQAEFAAYIATNQKTLSRWELDQNEPGDSAIDALGKCLGISAASIKTGVGFDPDRLPNPPRQVGNLFIPEDIAKTLVFLPKVSRNWISFVDRPHESDHAVSVDQAIKELRGAHGRGEPVWLVIGDIGE